MPLLKWKGGSMGFSKSCSDPATIQCVCQWPDANREFKEPRRVYWCSPMQNEYSISLKSATSLWARLGLPENTLVGHIS